MALAAPVRVRIRAGPAAVVGRGTTGVAWMVADVRWGDLAVSPVHAESIGAGLVVRFHRRPDSGGGECVRLCDLRLALAYRTRHQSSLRTSASPGAGHDRRDCADVCSL